MALQISLFKDSWRVALNGVARHIVMVILTILTMANTLDLKADCDLTLALREGFSKDQVQILVNGQGLIRLDHVSTRLQIGLAKELKLPLTQKRNTITIEIPTRASQASIEIDITKVCYLAVDVSSSGQEINFTPSDIPFRYM